MTSKFSIVSDTPEQSNGQARFTVIGVGGGGGNAVEHMVQSNIKNVTFVCANTDKQALDKLTAQNKIQLGAKTNRGLGAGANPEVGREAAESEEEQIRQLLASSDMVFITAGMGGGTGTGAAPVIARLAKELGILTVAVVTMPFGFEGGKRIKVANEGISQLSNFVDSIITIPNDKLMSVYGKISMKDAFKKADEVLLQAVQGISSMVDEDGYINIDFQDVRTAMSSKGYAMMGLGRASGEDRAAQATEKAIRSPLLDNLLLKNAKGLLVNVVSSSDFSLEEYARITQTVEGLVDIDVADIFYGVVFDDNIGDEMHVTVIATGLTLDYEPTPRVAPVSRPFVPDVTSHHRVETRETAVGAQRPLDNSIPTPQPTAQVPSRIQPSTNPPQPSQAPQPASRSASIQDYLRRHQNGNK